MKLIDSSSSPFLESPGKSFLVHLYPKAEKCIRLKFLVRRESLFILGICEKETALKNKVRDFTMALRGPKRFQGFRETGPRTEKEFLALILKFSSLPLPKSWISQS